MTRHQSIMLFRSILLRSQGCHSKTVISRFQSNTGSAQCENTKPKDITVHGNKYNYDDWTNITPKILSLSERKLHLNPKHPLGLIKQNIINYVYSRYNQNQFGAVYRNPAHGKSPLFSVHQNLSPIVSIQQNFDSLLVPQDHPSRVKSDSYYLNKNYMLRAHTSAHQSELIRYYSYITLALLLHKT